MEEWKISRVEYVNRKRGELSRARGACSKEQLKAIEDVSSALQAFEWEFNETILGGGSANDIPIGTYTQMLKTAVELAHHWEEPNEPDFYEEVMDYKRQQVADEIQSFEELVEAVNTLSIRKCVTCGTKLKGRQKKLCGKKKCKDKFYAKK